MITKTGWQIARNHERDKAIQTLQQPEVTRGKGMGTGAGTGGIIGGVTGLVAGRGRPGAAVAGASLGAAAGAGLGELSHRKDKSQRGEATNYLQHYNNQRIQEIMRQRQMQRQRQIMAQRRQAAEQEAKQRSPEK